MYVNVPTAWGQLSNICLKCTVKCTAVIFKELFRHKYFSFAMKYFTLWFENKVLSPPHSDWALTDAQVQALLCMAEEAAAYPLGLSFHLGFFPFVAFLPAAELTVLSQMPKWKVRMTSTAHHWGERWAASHWRSHHLSKRLTSRDKQPCTPAWPLPVQAGK